LCSSGHGNAELRRWLVKKFILSDLHIGHRDSQYDVMDRAIDYVRHQAEKGDQIWGLGDWFHILENGFDCCINHPMTQKFRDLAGQVPTKLIPGNHDHELERYRDDTGLPNPITPIQLIKPFEENGIWYCHGHEYDPVYEYVPWILGLWNWLTGKRTPGRLKEYSVTERYLMAVNLVHSRALLGLRERARKEGRTYKGIVIGHTHLPLQQETPELPFLLNDGDMRHSSTFAVEDDVGFRILQWNSGRNDWQVTSKLSVTGKPVQ
jgi:UDP-2,3-diacylglucosamine pyrophosphatase LpxH